MPVPPSRRATYQDVLDAPEHLVAELIDGELVLSPRPAKPHAAAASALGEELGPPFKRGKGGPGGWIILWKPEVHGDEDVLVPDLAGWRRERMPAMTTEEAFFSLAPDWVCEVLSPRSAALDRVKKMRSYARMGVRHAWIVDPLGRSLEVFRLHEGAWLMVGAYQGAVPVRAEPFDAIELDLGVLWADVILPEP